MSELKHVEGRVICAVDLEAKNWHTFSNGTKIRRERQYNELNRRITEPTNAIVVSGKDIPSGVEILIHPNAVHDSNRIFNYKKLSGKDEASDIKYYAIRETDCFIYLGENGIWKPLKPFETALRVFIPYKGILEGIAPKQIKDCLYVNSGRLAGNVVKTIIASDYQIIFQDTTGKEGNLIRFRPDGDEKNNREPEAIAIMKDITKKVLNGEYIVGISISDAKPLKENANHNVSYV